MKQRLQGDIAGNKKFDPCCDDGATTSPFESSRIEHNDDSSRLVRLIRAKSGARTDALQCELISTRRSERIDQYIAVSYVWSAPTPTKTISLNGVPFVVRQNLFDFLHSCYHRGLYAWLWIDAICIDQSSTSERNHQVQGMKSNYQHASSVHAWLGPEKPNIVWLFENIVVKQGSVPISEDEAKATHGDKLLQVRWGLYEVSRCEYWQRLWVVQEYSLAKSVTLVCGASAAGWDSIGAYKNLLYMGDLSDALRAREEQRSNSTDRRFERLFYSQRKRLCNLAQDRVYAILGMVSDEALAPESTNLSSIVDYEQSSWELLRKLLCTCEFKNVMQFIITFCEQLSVPLNRLLDARYRSLINDTVSSDVINITVSEKWSQRITFDRTRSKETDSIAITEIDLYEHQSSSARSAPKADFRFPAYMLANIAQRPSPTTIHFIPLTNWHWKPPVARGHFMGNQAVLLVWQSDRNLETATFELAGVMARHWKLFEGENNQWRWTSFQINLKDLARRTSIIRLERKEETSRFRTKLKDLARKTNITRLGAKEETPRFRIETSFLCILKLAEVLSHFSVRS